MPSVAALPEVGPCVDEVRLRMHLGVDRGEGEAAVRRCLARIWALEVAGRYPQALAEAAELETEVQESGNAGLRAEALLAVGVLEARNSAYDDAEKSLTEAFLVAGREGSDEVAADAAIEMVFLRGYHKLRHADGLLWGKWAEMLLARIGQGTSLRAANAAHAIGVVHWSRGAYGEALAAHGRALAVRRATLGDLHPDVASSLNNIAIVHEARGALNEALISHRRALEIKETTLGPGHPDVAKSLNNMANVLFRLGDMVPAEEAYERAIAIWQATFGPSHAYIARALDNLGQVRTAKGEYDRAQADLERSIAIKLEIFGPDNMGVGLSLNNIGIIHRARGAYAAALQHLERAAKIFETNVDELNPHSAACLYEQGETLLVMGRPGAAVTRLRRAVAIFGQLESAEIEIAGSRFALARALLAEGGVPKEALVLAGEAAATYAGAGELHKGDLARVQTWLHDHGG